MNGNREDRRVEWRAIPVLLVALGLSGVAAAEAQPQADRQAGAESAASFVRLFFDGEYDRYFDRMSQEMQSAMTRETAETVRADLAKNGKVNRIGEAWMEDVVQGHRRYRVPVEYDEEILDLRVVFDAEGKIAGFFRAAHLAPPSGSGTEESAEVGRPELLGHWEGTIEIPGSPLPIVVDLSFEGGRWFGSFDSPAQGAAGLRLGGIGVAGDEITFAIQDVPGNPTFAGRRIDGRIEGTFTQAGQGFPFRLGREETALPARPQEPRRPFPYEEQEVVYASGEITLAGTLTLPPGAGPFPAVLLVSGSGAQNRDEELLGHKPFLVLSDHLTRAGIAVLRTDDRGVGGSTGDLSLSTTADLAGDALAGVRYLRGRTRVDPERVGLIGHSEGAIVAPLAASLSEDVAFVVMLAGSGVPGDEILVRQMERILRAGGLGGKPLADVLAEQRKLLDLILADAETGEIRAQLLKLTEAQLGSTPGAARPDSPQLEEMARQGTREVTSPWFRQFLSHDPRAALREVRVPVLALYGELDLQVDPEQNLHEVREALNASGNPDVTVRQFPKLNHLFQKARTGSPDEYFTIEETMNAAVLGTIGDWISERFGTR